MIEILRNHPMIFLESFTESEMSINISATFYVEVS